MNSPTCHIDGFGPLPIIRPSSQAELGELIRDAAAKGEAIYPMGGQTKLSIGMPPVKPGAAVDLQAMASIVDFPARDMTVTVQTGTTVKALCDTIATEKLRLPIDVAQADRATLGGILAANTSGPRRYGHGTLRDYVIGINVLNDEGREFKAGGRVVKNVAGYDLCKLLVGSLGTLGIITQATLKLRPIADVHALLCLGCSTEHVEELLARLHGSRTRPVCVELLNQRASQVVLAGIPSILRDDPWVVLVGYEGNLDAVTWQVQEVVQEVGAYCQVDARVDFTAKPLWDALIDIAALPSGQTTFKANIVPSAVAAFCLSADRAPQRPLLWAQAGNGIVTGLWADDLTKQRVPGMLTAWRERAAQGHGSVVVLRCPCDWKSALDVWGPAPANAWLMREVKLKFDPKRIFNPGRFVDGI